MSSHASNEAPGQKEPGLWGTLKHRLKHMFEPAALVETGGQLAEKYGPHTAAPVAGAPGAIANMVAGMRAGDAAKTPSQDQIDDIGNQDLDTQDGRDAASYLLRHNNQQKEGEALRLKLSALAPVAGMAVGGPLGAMVAGGISLATHGLNSATGGGVDNFVGGMSNHFRGMFHTEAPPPSADEQPEAQKPTFARDAGEADPMIPGLRVVRAPPPPAAAPATYRAPRSTGVRIDASDDAPRPGREDAEVLRAVAGQNGSTTR